MGVNITKIVYDNLENISTISTNYQRTQIALSINEEIRDLIYKHNLMSIEKLINKIKEKSRGCDINTKKGRTIKGVYVDCLIMAMEIQKIDIV